MTIVYACRCGGCPRGCPWGGGDIWPLLLLLLLLWCLMATSGCVKAPSTSDHKPFEAQELDACLAIVVDMSGSFAARWEDRAYPLFLNLMDQFFTAGAGGETRVIIAQLSGNDKAVLFEGTPDELRSRFRSPSELSDFLAANSDGSRSNVYHATTQTLNYVSSIAGVTENTRTLTVLLSDLQETESDPNVRRRTGRELLTALKRYQQRGGGLALYYVADREVARWQEALSVAGFDPGTYVIENNIVENPQLPRFD